MGANRRDEQFAQAVVGRVLGLSVEEYDTAGRQSAVDALLHYPDGRTAALEISSLGSGDEAAVLNILDRDGHKRTVAGLSKTWSIWVPHDLTPRKLRLLGDALRFCEGHGLPDLKQAATSNPEADELHRIGVRGTATSPLNTDSQTVWIHVAPLHRDRSS